MRQTAGNQAEHWEHHRDLLQNVVERPRFGLISYFDGTLSAYALLPDTAVIVPEDTRLLDTLASHESLRWCWDAERKTCARTLIARMARKTHP